MGLKEDLEFNSAEQAASRFTDRMVRQLVKLWQREHGLKDDGRCGPVTQASIQLAVSAELPENAVSWNPAAAAPWDGPMSIPRNRKEAYATYGNPGVGKVDPSWESANMIVARDLPGIPNGKLYVHKLVEPYLREALRRCEAVAPGYIKHIGCFNFRHSRHDPRLPLSYHSFGAAVDINASDNAAKYFKVGESPEPWTPEWLKEWPKGMSKDFVSAWTSVGWTWGSDWDRDGKASDHTFNDPMHFQLVGEP